MAKLYFGSASILGKSSHAYVLVDRKYFREKGIIDSSRLIAEYEALTRGLSFAISKDIKRLTILGPKLVVYQLTGNTPIKSRKVVPLYSEVKLLLPFFRKVVLSPIPSKRNKAFPPAIESLKEFFEGKSIMRCKEIPDKRIRKLDRFKFLVDNHVVDLGMENCSCEFFKDVNTFDVKKAGMVIRCKHIFAAERFISSQIGALST